MIWPSLKLAEDGNQQKTTAEWAFAAAGGLSAGSVA
jgi:hypothetical protein